jgi:hypothetical protein
MGTCFTNEGLVRNPPNIKAEISTDGSSSPEPFSMEIIPPSEVDHRECAHLEFQKNPERFFIDRDIKKCFKKRSLSESLFLKKNSSREESSRLIQSHSISR